MVLFKPGTVLRMDSAESILRQIDVTMGVRIARFVASTLGDFLDPWDVCVMSLLGIFVSYLSKQQNQLVVLGRRLGCLLIVEKLNPWLRGLVSYRPGIQAVLLNSGLVVLLTFVPKSIQSDSEGRIIFTSVLYVFLAAVQIDGGPQLWVAVISCWVVVWASHSKVKSLLWQQCVAVASLIATNTLMDMLAPTNMFDDAALLYLSLQTVILCSAVNNSLIASTRSYVIYNMASIIEPAVNSDFGVAFVFLFFVVLHNWFGLDLWVTQVCLLVFVGLVVNIVLSYVTYLSASDTVVTLKVCALVLQFLIHEFSRNMLRSP